MNNIILYIRFFLTFIIGQFFYTLSIKYYPLKYKSMSILKTILYSIPLMIIGTLYTTYSLDLVSDNELTTPIQDIYILVITQFVMLLIIGPLLIDLTVSRSDIICFFIILLAFYISFSEIFSKYFGLPLSQQRHNEEIQNIEHDYQLV